MDPWFSHLDGVGQLILLRGPEQHKSSFGNQIFQHFRANDVGPSIPSLEPTTLISQALRAILTRKSSFLGEPIWCEIPFEEQPKDPFHSLMDTVFKFATVLEMNDRAKSSSQPEIKLQRKLAVDCEHISKALNSWLVTFTQLFPGGIIYTPTPSYPIVPEDSSPDGPVFSTYLQFPDLAIAQITITY